ncbi:putative PTH11-typeG-protein-coupled receptor [Trichoderma atroviride IMI 206040]|uniref:PTH11-typeG-protein-coupled receptor n=1 Tax=Hypocrea atroviridis (strain ATCC 20476 / IMI 206040) TaxID=452589 RepID=G9NL72_HYPAI|nr:putative PTH11-typeG-protein-coupled receptor [Trichoderma atroviride IMI 206040]EHK48858.1 putative PTH11-typeG-protein-coupled receptor [Trichoderma atroviride IMI 206040]
MMIPPQDETFAMDFEATTTNRNEMDKSQASTIQIFLLLGSAVICIAARSFMRFRQCGWKSLGLEDVFAVAGVIFFVPNVVLAYLTNTMTHWMSNQTTLEGDFIGTQPNSNEHYLMELGSKLYLYNWLSYSTALWTLKAAFLAYVIRQTAASGRRQTHQTFGFGFLFVTWVATTLAFSQSCRRLSNMSQVYPDPSRYCQPVTSPALVLAYFSFDTITTLYLAMAAMPLALKRGKPMRDTLQWLTTLVCGLIFTAAALTRAIILVSNHNPGAEQTAEILAIWQIFVLISTVGLTECFYHPQEPSYPPDLKDIEDARFNDFMYSSRFSTRQHSLAESEVTIVVDPNEEDMCEKDVEVSVQELAPEGRRNSWIERKIEVSVLQESFIVAPEGPCNICGNYTKGWANDEGANKPEQRSHYFGSDIHFHVPRYGRKTCDTSETMI